MRDLKFRAWHKQSKCMMRVHNFDFVDGFHAMLNDGKSDFLCKPEQMELMQFTGLKDKNGVEVYEGDIVLDHTHNFNLIVKWCEGKHEHLGAQIGWWLDDGYYSVEFTAYLGALEIGREEYANVSVLGNIYEHPDLLKTMNSFGYDPITGKQRGEA